MAYVRHEARLDLRNADGVAPRAALELRASQGAAGAIEALTPPEYPEGLSYLLGWLEELVGRSGVGMDGLAPLTWQTLDAWADRTGRHPTPEECTALMLLDGAYRHPDEPAQKAAPGTPTPAVIRAWPSKQEA